MPGADTFRQRVQALGRAHGVLTQEQWRGTGLRELAEAVLGGFVDGEKLRFEGPVVRLSPNAAISLSMTLHELGTNALKHGALSTADGNVQLNWESVSGSDAEKGRLRLAWSEHDGLSVSSPIRKGFGRRMLEQGIAHELGGEVQLGFDTAGLVCRMSFPAARVLSREKD